MLVGDAEFLRERQVGSVGSRVVPSLNCTTERADCDQEVQSFRLRPPVRALPGHYSLVLRGELWDEVVGSGVLSEQGGFAEKLLVETVLSTESIDVGIELILGEVSQRVLDLSIEGIRTSRCRRVRLGELNVDNVELLVGVKVVLRHGVDE